MGTLTATLQKGTLCAPLPPTIQLIGQTVSSKVNTNPVTGSTIVFTGGAPGGPHAIPAPPAGDTWCGTTAGPQTIVFTNTGDPGTSYHIMSVAFAGTEYTATIGGATFNNNVVQAGTAGVTISIASAAIPGTWSFTNPDTFDDTVTVTTDAPGDAPHTFTLQQSPYGAVLSAFKPTPVGAGKLSGGTVTLTFSFKVATNAMSIDNSGNASITINPMLTPNNVQSQGIYTVDSPIVAGPATINGTTVTPTVEGFDARWKPKAADTTYTATIDFDYSGAALCNPYLFPVVDLTGDEVLPLP